MMILNTGDTLCGFTVTRVRESEELGARVVEMVYPKTGTELCWVDNGEENKLFSITFKTLPENSTGVFHILEHSVLCGSEKYPVREPFVELIKSSMNTFLNAMTFQDKTMYPISSRNEKDFLNLTGVYLDAVFAPAILENPNIFYQEGWHLEEGDQGPAFKGVVFNEMKGALSGVDQLCEEKMIEMLFPGSPYGFNSGGDPTEIPRLTYEEFKDTYRRFYHPGNAKIFLDGAVPPEATLSLIAEYLQRFAPAAPIPDAEDTLPTARRETVTYDLAAEESPENKGHLLWGRIVGSWQDHTRLTAVSVLKRMLCGSNESPLKKAILAARLAEDADIDLDNIIPQPYVVMHFTNIKDGAQEELLSLVRQTLQSLRAEGLSKDALHNAANRMEFSLLEPDEPAGLERCIAAMTGWLHGGDPLEYMCYREDFRAVHEMIDRGEMEDLLEDIFLREEDAAILLALPSHTKGEEDRAAEAERVAALYRSWGEEKRAENRRLNESLVRWQQTPDSRDALATLPKLSLKDVGAPAAPTPTEESTEGAAKVLFHKVATRNIVHLSLYFSLSDRTPEELSLLSAGQQLWGKLATRTHSAEELEQALKRHVGAIRFSVSGFGKNSDPKAVVPVFAVRMSALSEEFTKAKELLVEILTSTRFDEKEKIFDILVQLDEEAKQQAIAAGHLLAMGNATAPYSAAGALADAISGHSYSGCIHALRENFTSEYDGFCAKMRSLETEAFCQSRLTLSVTHPTPVPLGDLVSALPVGTPLPETATYTSALPDRMGTPIPAMIGFSGQGYHLNEMGEAYHGRLSVASNLLSFGYLWNAVRVQGGAYGTGIMARRNGTIVSYSYRDPSPQASIEANRGLGDFLRAFCSSEEDITGYVISTLSRQDPLHTPKEKGAIADINYFSGITPEDDKRVWQEILSTDKDALLQTLPVWEAFAKEGRTAIVGFSDMLEGMNLCE